MSNYAYARHIVEAQQLAEMDDVDLNGFVVELEIRTGCKVVSVERYETNWKRAKITFVHESGNQFHVRAYYNGGWALSGTIDLDKIRLLSGKMVHEEDLFLATSRNLPVEQLKPAMDSIRARVAQRHNMSWANAR